MLRGAVPAGVALGGGRAADAAGPRNLLGARWTGLSSPGVGSYGTPDAGSNGYSFARACIRMLVPQAEWLSDHVEVGTTVSIVAS